MVQQLVDKKNQKGTNHMYILYLNSYTVCLQPLRSRRMLKTAAFVIFPGTYPAVISTVCTVSPLMMGEMTFIP